MKSKQAKSQLGPSSLQCYLNQHYQAACETVARIWHMPLSHSLTMLVIAITLSLPLTLWVLLNNVKPLGEHWQRGTQISLYLQLSTSPEKAQALAHQLRLRSDVGKVDYISPEEGLAQFTLDHELSDVMSALPENPLPPVIEVFPARADTSAVSVDNLLLELKQLPEVQSAILDARWLERLQSFLRIGQRIIDALALLFVGAVLLIIGNTIRLAMHDRREEIAVSRWVGATNAFVRRPFLYAGFFYGIAGGLGAWILLQLFLWGLSGPTAHLAALYHSRFVLNGLNMGQFFFMLLLGGFLGWLGALLTVNRELRLLSAS